METGITLHSSNDTLTALHIIAADFREALESVRHRWGVLKRRKSLQEPFEIQFGGVSCFPENWCDRTSRILTRYLNDVGYEQAVRINSCSIRGGGGHEWVLVDDIIIDITADQFEAIRPRPLPVIVTTDHSWHNQYFEHFTRYEYKPGWNNWGEYDPELLDTLYDLVVEHMERR